MTDLKDDEAPLDPATERLRRKMLRLLAIAVATMMLGVMAVLAAVVYKIRADGADVGLDGAPVAIALPAGADIAEMALDGDEALLRLGGAGEGTLLRVDLRTGRTVGRFSITAR